MTIIYMLNPGIGLPTVGYILPSKIAPHHFHALALSESVWMVPGTVSLEDD